MIRVEGLKVSRAGRPLLHDVTFAVPRGHVVGLLGPNGAGKTTTLKVLCGLWKPDAGEVRFAPLVGSLTEPRPRLGCMIETPGFYPNLTAAENLLLFSRDRSVQARSQIDLLVARLGLSSAQGKLVGQYSLGMKQRLGIARALLGRPDLVVLDEPINGLDPHGILDVRELIRELSRGEGTTFVVSSHILSEIELVADEVVVIDEGRTVATLPVAEATGARAEIHVDRADAAARALRETWPALECDVKGEGVLFVTGLAQGVGAVNRFLVERGHDVSALIPLATSLEQRVMPLMKRGL